MTILLAILSGAALGYALERGDMCFHSTLRGLFREPRQLDLFRAYILTLLVATPLVTLMRGLGWIEPWIPPFTWGANVVGGVIFGAGMVVAASCITGFFYKLGHGMLGVLVGLVTWAVGDILVYLGPLSGLRARLTANPIEVTGSSATVLNLIGPGGWLLLAAAGLGAIIWLRRAPSKGIEPRGQHWGWLVLGLAVGLVTSASWLLARAGSADFPYGTSYVPSQIYLAVFSGERSLPWIPITLFSLIIGAFLAAIRSGTLWVRGESPRRYLGLGIGGFLMGVGAALAGGCNLGHALIGVPTLSIGSIVTVAAMLVGVFIAHQITNLLNRQFG